MNENEARAKAWGAKLWDSQTLGLSDSQTLIRLSQTNSETTGRRRAPGPPHEHDEQHSEAVVFGPKIK